MYRCRVERHSVSPTGKEIVSFLVTYPRVVLAEVVTHRMVYEGSEHVELICPERTATRDVSKNSASSRAIPYERLRQSIAADPYIPAWTANQKGMQGEGIADQTTLDTARVWCRRGLENALFGSDALAELGVHKQDCNRYLEPWMWVTQILTATEWDNFFALRCHKDAHPAFQRIARMMFLAKRKSIPDQLDYGQWHLPFVPRDQALALHWTPNPLGAPLYPQLIESIARCAWLSYENHEKDATFEACLATYERLLGGEIKHASPIEHQATPMHPAWESSYPNLRSNLRGWIQARKLIAGERVEKYEPSDEEVSSWGIDESDLWPE